MNIKLLRMALCMNTATAARYLAARPDHPDGVSETTWVRWERGKKPVPDDVLLHLQQIADRLHDVLMPIAELGVNLHDCNDVSPMIAHHDSKPDDVDMIEYHIALAVSTWANALKIKVESIKNG